MISIGCILILLVTLIHPATKITIRIRRKCGNQTFAVA